MPDPHGFTRGSEDRARIVADMLHRSFAGPIANVFAIGVLVLGTDLVQRHPIATSLFLGILCVRLLARAVFALLRQKPNTRIEPPLWLIGVSAYLLSAPSGCFAAFVLHENGYENWDTVLMYVFVMVCAISGTRALAPDLRLSLGYQGSLLSPVIVTSFWIGGTHAWVGTTAAILFGGYVVLQAIRENADHKRTEAASAALKKRAEELEVAQTAAAAASEAKSRFLANMSHEIRTPMNGVLGMLELVLRADLSLEQRQDLECARDSAQSLLALLNQLLDHAKAEAGRLELERTDFRIRDVVSSAVAPFRAQAVEKGIALTCSIEPAVPVRVGGDPTRLRQVIVNLVANALKFTTAGSIQVSVDVESISGSNAAVAFVVADTGPGIPADKQETIFDAFSQADGSITRRFGGTGLGLAICRDLVQLMGGRISVESQVGRGSVFRFTAVFDTAPDARSEADPAQDESTASRPLRVLVAEDNAVNQRILTRMLEDRGHVVAIAEDGVEAVAHCSESRFDVVLMDVQMPTMDGLEATHRIRASSAGRVPIIGVTAGATPAELAACLEAGMDACITKPIDTSKLHELLGVFSNGRPSTGAGCEA